MNRSIIIALAISICSYIDANAQVGINTTTPEATLHVNGDLKVDELSKPTIIAKKLLGVDDNGNIRTVKVGENVRLVNNELISINRTLRVGSTSPFNASTIHNVNLLIFPGETNEGKSIISINNTNSGNGDTEITGIKAGTDGMHIWLYAISGKVTLKDNDSASLPQNRIQTSSKMSAKQWEMIELVYDATTSKWIIMNHHD